MQDYEIPENRIMNMWGGARRGGEHIFSHIKFFPEDFDYSRKTLLDAVESCDRVRLTVGHSDPMVVILMRVSIDFGGSGVFEIQTTEAPETQNEEALNTQGIIHRNVSGEG